MASLLLLDHSSHQHCSIDVVIPPSLIGDGDLACVGTKLPNDIVRVVYLEVADGDPDCVNVGLVRHHVSQTQRLLIVKPRVQVVAGVVDVPQQWIRIERCG